MRRILYLKSSKDTGALAEASFQLSPQVYVPGAHEIYLDIGATEKVFGGEARLLLTAETLAETFLSQRGERKPWITVLTDRPEWARVLAESGGGRDVWLPPGKSAAYLRGLPLEGLIVVGDPKTVERERPERTSLVAFMKRVGLRTLGDFSALPPAAVGKRFGQPGVVLLDWVRGHRELKLEPFFPQAPLRELLDADEVTSLEGLLFVLKGVLVRLEARLRGRARAAKRLTLDFYFESTAPRREELYLAEPLQEAEALHKGLSAFLEGRVWDSPLVRLTLEVSDSMPHFAAQLSLLDELENRFHELSGYVARLRARYSDAAVGFPALRDSHLPERAWELVSPPEAPPPRRQRFPERPLFLFQPPRPCSPPKHWQLIATENVVAEWWEEGGNRRYFVAKNPEGHCLWVYWDVGREEWFLHGTFD